MGAVGRTARVWGSTSSYSYALAEPEHTDEGEEGLEQGSHGSGVIDIAAAAAAAGSRYPATGNRGLGEH